MTRNLRKLTLTIPEEGNLVERDAPGQAPKAFRIWSAGENRCDDESVFFTEKSAELLLQEQAERGRLYSFDFDHLSLSSDRPASSGRAAGWHQLEVRKDAAGQSELWAVNIDWCADAKAGLEAQPPHWRYFSPAFFTNSEGEIVSYVNCALCINPLTHQLPSLANIRGAAASTGVGNMDEKAVKAALAVLASSESSDEEKKEAAKALAAHYAAADGEEKKDEDEDEPSESADGEDEKKDEEEKKDEAKAASFKLASENLKLKSRLDNIDKRDLISKRPDLSDGVREWLQSQSLATVKSFLAKAPVEVERRSSLTQDQASDDGEHPIDRAFGIRKAATHLGLGKPVNGVRTLSFKKGA